MMRMDVEEEQDLPRLQVQVEPTAADILGVPPQQHGPMNEGGCSPEGSTTGSSRIL